MLIDTFHAAFEDRKEAFNRIGMGIATYVLIGAVLHNFMRSEIPADAFVDRPFVGAKVRLARHVLVHTVAHLRAAHIPSRARASSAATLDQTHAAPLVTGT